MTEATPSEATDEAPVFRLIYRSHSQIGSADRSAQLAAIFTTARRRNRELGVTGALMINDDAFVQTLEGDEEVVRELFERISGDPRHNRVSLLEDRTVSGRVFGRWAMAKVSTEGGPDIRLLSNPRHGEIVAAPRDPSVTPAQETVLEGMRGALAAGALG